ncbi:hypothetical protein F511_02682 [Dorcoceras hygrometricum]|uniref:Uncharacterized protein n=1 Tax=Dorcoceras hygrometricum TaxID=472368 RepID=A0A2Z7DB93_9LAMI|nr:hypothetical protein F511_02682 [Dorcoceras hygrometricum]
MDTRVVALDSYCQGDSSHTSFEGLGLAGGRSRRHLSSVVCQHKRRISPAVQVGGGRSSQSGPRPEARVHRQSALEELTKFPRMESPRKDNRNKSDHGGGGGVAVEGRRP